MIRIPIFLLTFLLSRVLAHSQDEKHTGIIWEKENLLNDSMRLQFIPTEHTLFAFCMQLVSISEEPTAEIKKMREFIWKVYHKDDSVIGQLSDSSRWQFSCMQYMQHSGMMLQSQVNTLELWSVTNDAVHPLTVFDIRKELEKDSTYSIENKLHTVLNIPDLLSERWYFVDLGDVLVLKIYGQRTEKQNENQGIPIFNDFYSTWEVLYFFEKQ